MKSYTLLSVVIFGLWLARAHEIHAPVEQRSLSHNNDSNHHHIKERSLIGGGFKLKDVLGLAGLLPKKITAAPQMILVGIVDQPVPSAVAVPMPSRPVPPARPAYPPPAYPSYPQPSYRQPSYPQPSYAPPQYSAPAQYAPPPSYPPQPAYQASYQQPQAQYPPMQQQSYSAPAPAYPPAVGTPTAAYPPAAGTPAPAYPPAAGTAKTQVVSDSSTNSTSTERQLSEADALRWAAFDNSIAGQSDPSADNV